MSHDQILNGIGDDDVIRIINSSDRMKTFCISEFREVLDKAKGAMKRAYGESLKSQGHSSFYTGRDSRQDPTYNGWFDDSGAECKLLRLGDNQWKSGKVRVRIEVEFIPDDEEDSNEVDEPSLDTFRDRP